jgi:hypothetical protein
VFGRLFRVSGSLFASAKALAQRTLKNQER